MSVAHFNNLYKILIYKLLILHYSGTVKFIEHTSGLDFVLLILNCNWLIIEHKWNRF